jgi:hypothetical protein
MTINRAYKLADKYTSKTNAYTRINIERWNFNHKENNNPRIEYKLNIQGCHPETFNSTQELVGFLKDLLDSHEG